VIVARASIRDLKDKKVGIQGAGAQQHAFVAAMAAHVGLNPAKDIDWVISASPPPMELFAEGSTRDRYPRCGQGTPRAR
jgi:NitT/TauT family transport system substrate-binding protein